jgi:hypothetical protein
MSGPPIVPEGNRLVVFGSQLIGVVIVIVGLFTQQGELHSWRPTGTKNQVSPEPQIQGKFARLWDDPLEDMPAFPVVSKKQSDSAKEALNANPSQELQPAESSSSETSRPAPAANYLFLWNILDARPLPESRERRLRIRYAVVSAILTEGYLPLLSPRHRPPLVSVFDDKQKRVGYFETFRRAGSQGNGKYEYVCVIWTPKHLTSLPISEDKLETIKVDIGKADGVLAKGDVRILHHGSSEDLYKYVAAPEGVPPKQDISFMRATIPWGDLNPYLGSATPRTDPLSLQKITTDDILVKDLVEELSLRIPALNDTSKMPRVVVFTESDTNYSRAIEHELEDRLKHKNKKVRLDVFSYLRALDGRPEETRAPAVSEGSKPQDVATSLLQGRAISETSFGTSQFDYLRRAAIGLEGNVVAVGILGSDIYDKMLVLQAVRPRLSSAIFFTTDLDALYFEREVQPVTRNLVVASADGLDANESGVKPTTSWNLPSMRDSYQTVLVKEVRNILTGNASEKSESERASAHIFEIAPGKSIELSLPGPSFFETHTAPFLLRQLAKPWLSVVIFLLALGNGFLILWAISTRKAAPDARMKAGARTFVGVEVALAGIGLLCLLYMLWLSHAPSLFGEPLDLGVSIWPSVMIRLLAFLVAIVLLSLASYSMVVYGRPQKENLKNALPENVKFRFRKSPWGEFISGSFGEFMNPLFDAKARKWRIAWISLGYLVVSFVLFMKWPPMVPARGALPFLIEKIVLALGVALYIIHLIFCLDLHLFSLRVLRQLRSSYHAIVEQAASITASASAAGVVNRKCDESSTTPTGNADANALKPTQMLAALSTLTMVIGKTLLYPLTVLILIILSRLNIFDNWVMTPSLTLTFAGGALVLVAASLILWLEGARLKKIVLAQTSSRPDEKEKLQAINDGVFAAWYNQPIFSAIFSVAAVFGSLSIAGPLTRLFFYSF